MGVFAERMAQVELKVYSPDRQVKATWTQRSNLSFEFRPGRYAGYREDELASQLSNLLDSLYAARASARLEALSAAFDRTVTSEDERVLLDAPQRRFRELRSQVTPVGKSKKDLVRIKNTAMRNWRVRIKPEALSALSEAEFVVELTTAMTALMTDLAKKVAVIRTEIYGSGLRIKQVQRPLLRTGTR